MEKASIIDGIAGQISLTSLVLEADVVVQTVMIILLISSIWSWSTFFSKNSSLNKILKNFIEIEELFLKSDSLENFHKKIQNFPNHPTNKVFMSAIAEFSKNQYDDLESLSDYEKSSCKERLESAMEVAHSKITRHSEKSIPFLATIAASAPFIGLFGTVWGIMNSFQSIATAKNSTLAIVAPGIAESLLATAIGLIVAIPALIFYNYLSTKINLVIEKSEDFSGELNILFSRKLSEK